MPSPIALTSPPRQESIFKKRSPSYLNAMRSARARIRDSASVTSTPALSLSSSATTLSEDTILHDTPYDNSDGLAYPTVPPTSDQLVSADHLQFGFCHNENYRYRSAHKPGTKVKEVQEQDPPYYILLTTYLSYLFLICMGHIRDFVGKRLQPAFYRHLLPFNVSHSPLIPRSGYSRLVFHVIRLLICVLPTGLRASQLRFRFLLHSAGEDAYR